MKLFGIRQTLLAAGIVVAAACISCSHHNSSSGSSAAAKNVKPGPEESFKLIMDIFRRRMEEIPIGFVMTNASGRTMMTGANKVQEELIRPAKEGEPYKAVVTVSSQSNYSIKRIVEAPDDPSGHDKNSSQKDNSLADKDDKAALPFDSGSSSSGDDQSKSRSALRPGDEAVTQRPDKEVRKYELLYQDGRWVLVTKLSLETEQSIQNAFKNALDTQTSG